MAKEPSTTEPPKLIPVVINRDFWAGREYEDQWPRDENGAVQGLSDDGATCRIRAGSPENPTTFNLTRADYVRLVKSGGVDRNDPLPGD